MSPADETRAVDETAALHRVLRELEFRMAVTTAILGTLELDKILYVILSGITSGDGLGFNRAMLFLDDGGRSLRVRMAVGPTSIADAVGIWREIERHGVDFSALLPRFEAFKQSDACQLLTSALSSFDLPLHRLEAVAATRHALILQSEAPLAAVLARCVVNRLPFCSNSLQLTIETGGAAGEVIELSHVALVPLAVGERLVGAIVADNGISGAHVDSDKLRSLHAIGNLAALAIDRAHLHARTVAMAEVDGLTGVYNRRHYEAQLSEALAAARATDEPLSILLFDLDHFKTCNDRHGHLVGDEVLKGVARLIEGQVRQSDMVARYGGEEFVVLLRNTAEEAAVQVAEKLRREVREAPLAGGEAVTVSAGVARSRGVDTPAELFARADTALYQAKQAGRDRVVLWTPDLPPLSA